MNFDKFVQKRCRVNHRGYIIEGKVVKVCATHLRVKTKDGKRNPYLAKINSIVEIDANGNEIGEKLINF